MSSLRTSPTAEGSIQSQWFSQLDGVRALAVTLVFIHHWTVGGKGVGSIGVQLFFVLSGFLITGILLRERQEIEAGRQSFGFSVRQFYVRRFLRIFPLYYFCLSLCLAIGRFEIKQTFLWHFFYLSNVLFLLKDQFVFPFAHFWSLAVEEQFYVFWPCVVLLCPRRYLNSVLLALISLAPLSRLVMVLSGHPDFVQSSTMVWANFDTLGMGALIAVLSRTSEVTQTLANRRLTFSIPLCLAELLISHKMSNPVVGVCLDPIAIALLSVWIVWNAAIGFKSIPGRLLNNPVLAYLGKISYGLYVWHMFAPVFVGYILKSLHLPVSLNEGAIGFVLFFIWTVVTASITWFVFEKPINGLKRYFPYRKKPTDSVLLAEVAVGS